ncbi:MAG: DUF3810 domain-containing protein [Oscillospiraceae bacterium]|nr:DUF3810 domain-containing protein [Oscillospiraceae bacterium]
MFRFIGRFIASAVILVLTGLMMAAAKYLPQLVFPAYRNFSRSVISAMSSVTGALPFALWEILLVLLGLLLLYSIIHTIFEKKRFLTWLSGVVLALSVLVFLFVGLWGLNHYAPELSTELNLPVTEYTKEQLAEAAQYYLDGANQYAVQVERDDTGVMAEQNFTEWAKEAGASYEPLAARYPIFSASTQPVKKALLTWKIMSETGYTGVFVAFTAESTVNPDTFVASLPYTMCHEVAHRCTIAGEDEANFAAFLACAASSDPDFLYSGYYSAFIYCYNALFDADKAAAQSVWEGTSEQLRADCAAANVHYDQYAGPVQDAAQKVNDTYLKAFSEESGVQSYGEVTDDLIAWYLQNKA